MAAIGALVLAASPAAHAEPPPTAPAVAAKVVHRSPAAVREYWTPERMENAVPAGLGPPARGAGRPSALRAGAPSSAEPSAARSNDLSSSSSAFPARVHGKVFLTLDGADYVCSGTVVSSPSHTLAWTAGHCVNGADFGAGFASNWMFVPGFVDGQRPFGDWVATTLLTTDEWANTANVRFDLGAAVLARDVQGRGIEDVVGARGIAFNQPRAQALDIFGYPADDSNTFLLPPNFNGQRLFSCPSAATGDDNPSPQVGPATMAAECDMTGGSSGGGWVAEGGLVESVTSYVYQFDPGYLYGPYLGDSAKELYGRAGGAALVCAERAVTNLGSSAPDAFTGTPGADSFRLVGADDSAVGSAGNDAACGGGGADRLAGDEGSDRLRGGGGDDVLRGGPGRDLCDGGSGRDRAFGCEVVKRIP